MVVVADFLVDLMNRVEESPRDVLDQARSAIDLTNGNEQSPYVSELWRVVGVASRILGEFGPGLAAFENAVATAPNDEQRARARASRAATLMQTGRMEEALADIEWALTVLTTGPDRGFALYQWGAIVVRDGRHKQAEAATTAAIGLLRGSGSWRYLAGALTNRGLMRAYAGEFDEADSDLHEAERIYLEHGLTGHVGTTRHNLGFVAARRGQLADALMWYEQAREQFALAGMPVAGLAVEQCEVLLSAGMALEARRRIREVIVSLDRAGNLVDLAEAELLAATIAVAAGRLGEADEHARTASNLFAVQERPWWRCQAELVACEARAELDVMPIDEVRQIVDSLAGVGDRAALQRAHLLLARCSFVDGESAAALDTLEALDAEQASIEVGSAVRTLRCEILADSGEGERALAGAAHMLDDIEQQQALVVATDVRAQITRHTTRLQALGRRYSWRSRDAASLFEWIERGRASALRHRPVNPPDDPVLAARLIELRGLRQDSPADRRDDMRVTELERAISDRARSGLSAGARRLPTPTAREFSEQLTGAGADALVLGEAGGRLVSCSFVDGALEVADHGSFAEYTAMARSSHQAMNRLLRGAAGRSSEFARQAVDDAATMIEREILRETIGDRGDRPVVVVPQPILLWLPWARASSLRGRPFSISPSATIAVAAMGRTVGESGWAVVAGPSLVSAAHEVEALSRMGIVGSCDRSVASGIAALSGDRPCHVAAHFRQRAGNALLSSFLLDDGALYLHEIDRLGQAAPLVVLSSCEAASDGLGGDDETMDAAGILLRLGARTVVASANVVPDTRMSVDVLVDFHRRLNAGAGVAQALAETRAACDGEALLVAESMTAMGAW